MQLERDYRSLPLHPPFHFHLPPFCLSSPLSISLSPCFPVLLSPHPLTPATKSNPHRSPNPRYQPTLPMLQQFSTHPSSIHSTCPNPPVSVKPLISTPRLSIVSLFWLLTSWLLPTWLLLVLCQHQKVYRQPWPWHRGCRKLHD